MAFAAISFASVSCVQEEELHQKGEPDADGCYGVYFPAQESALTLDPAEPLTATVAVVRTVSKDNVTVPVKLVDETGIFAISELKFEDGQTESTLEITFDKADIGVKYGCSLAIEDPKFASKYGTSPVYLDFSVVREKWNNLGQATWIETGDGLFNNFEVPVTILQNDNNKNLYRVQMKWVTADGNEDCIYALDCGDIFEFTVLQPGDVIAKGSSAETKIQDNDLIYYEDYPLGKVNSNYDEPVYYVHPVWFGADFSFNRVLQYQPNGLPAGVSIAPYAYLFNAGGGWNLSGSAAVNIIFPGAILTDYSISIETGLAEEGELPVLFTLGTDVAKAKYAVYEGELNTAQKAKFAEAIGDGSETSAKEVPADGLFSVSLEKTGLYTIVGVTFDDKGAPHESAVAEFSYVAKGESVPVVLGAGLTATNKYTPQGFTSDNSLEFYVYGKDLTSVKLGLFKYVELVADANACLEAVKASESVDAETLALVNGEGYVDLFTKLNPGTQYGLIVVASNGYEETYVLEMANTTGDPLPVYMDYTAGDMKSELQPQKSEGYFGTYNYYAVDAAGELGMREYLGQATISDSSKGDLPADDSGIVTEYVNINGFFQYEAAILGFKDEYVWEYYDGYLYNLAEAEPLGAVSLQGSPFYAHLMIATEAVGIQYGYSSMLMGGFVADGYVAFASSQLYNGGTLGEYGLRLGLFADEAYQQYAGWVAGYDNLLLVDPAKDNNGLAPAAPAVAAGVAKLNAVKGEFCKGRVNYVETEKGRMRSIIDKYNSTPRNYAGNVAGIEGAEREVKAVDFKVGSAEPFKVEKTFKTLDRVF